MRYFFTNVHRGSVEFPNGYVEMIGDGKVQYVTNPTDRYYNESFRAGPHELTPVLPEDPAEAAFKAAWHEADRAGRVGERTRLGLAAAREVIAAEIEAAQTPGRPYGGYRADDIEFGKNLGREDAARIVRNK